MSSFWQMLVGPTPGERVNECMNTWVNGVEDTRQCAVAPRSEPPSDAASKIARAIEVSGDRWVFEDDQGHSHSYDLGITVSHGPSAVVWQGARDEHVRYGEHTILFEAAPRTADASVILDALKRRRVRYEQDRQAAKLRAEEERKAAQAKRAEDAIEKLSRGECLDDPFDDQRRYGSGISVVSSDSLRNAYARFGGFNGR